LDLKSPVLTLFLDFNDLRTSELHKGSKLPKKTSGSSPGVPNNLRITTGLQKRPQKVIEKRLKIRG
jgi:hypothetical protein